MKLNRLIPLQRQSGAASPSAEAAVVAVADDLVRQADAARDQGQFAQASALYAAALPLLPHRGDLHVQCGNMLKEIGDFPGAERAYRAAEGIMPDNLDLSMQLGHLFKSAGRLGPAEQAYGRCLTLNPDFEPARQELAQLHRSGWNAVQEAPDDTILALAAEASTPGVTRDLLPRPVSELMRGHAIGVEWRRLGRRERTLWGNLPVLRGVEACRGFCIAAKPITIIELLLNGLLVYRGRSTGGYSLPLENEHTERRKYVFNVWLDLSAFMYGRYEIEVRAIDVDREVISRTERIVIMPVAPASLAPDSDSVVAPESPGDPRSLDEQINTRPSIVRSPRRGLLGGAPRAVLVQRADQLGDLVVSVPAIRRIRALFPDAQLVGLVSKANRELADTLGLFDTLVAVDFPANDVERRRVMSLEAQAELARELTAFPIDLAIDLSEAESSRLLLPLAGAPLMVGFRSGQFPGLDVDFSANTYDKRNDHEIVPHAKKALGLVEWLAVLLDPTRNLAVRLDLDRQRLSRLGLAPDARFAVLHAGARARFSRWPHYLALAELLLQHTDLHVVMLTIDPEDEGRVPESLLHSDRFELLHKRLDFDDFDALASFCKVFVGDDSGPKHLASLRGAEVVSVQTARNNWVEWGQDNGGFIVTRRVPCAGCLIQDDWEAQECGRDFVCLTAITPNEVLSAILRLISSMA